MVGSVLFWEKDGVYSPRCSPGEQQLQSDAKKQDETNPHIVVKPYVECILRPMSMMMDPDLLWNPRHGVWSDRLVVLSHADW